MERLLEEQRNRPIDWDAINRPQREQNTRMAVMLAFLDQQGTTESGRGPVAVNSSRYFPLIAFTRLFASSSVK
jgi:hypothetical protein